MTFELAAKVGARGFEAEITVADGETVAILGPNGAGKSTLLNLTAGLLSPDRGRATLGGRVLFDVEPGRRRAALPAWKRGVSMLAQDALLFPHLSVRENVAFGPRSTGSSRAEARNRSEAWLRRVDAAELAERRPAELSGGQAQRVAVARALATEPELLLLDEPMAALDVSVAPAIRRMLREVLRDRTAIIVTHDVLDAYTLADRVVVLEAGRVVDAGPTRAVLDRPATPFAAGLAGLNLLMGTAVSGGTIELDDGQRLVARSAQGLEPGAAAALAVRPSAVRVLAPTIPGRHDNTITATVSDVEPRGDVVRIRAGRIAADVTPAEAADLDLQSGAVARFAFSAEDAVAYPV